MKSVAAVERYGRDLQPRQEVHIEVPHPGFPARLHHFLLLVAALDVADVEDVGSVRARVVAPEVYRAVVGERDVEPTDVGHHIRQ